jgi:hypothetical protein
MSYREIGEMFNNSYGLMRKITFCAILFCSMGLCSFVAEPGSVTEYEGLLNGVWKIESVKIRKVFSYQKVNLSKSDFYIQFDPTGRAQVLNTNAMSLMNSGSWRITRSETLVASDPFVYREDLILNLDFAIPQMSIESGDDIFLELKRSKLNVRYFRDSKEYHATLIPVHKE